ncbi:MAG TPA: hypothetical protein ENK97_01330 [Campylobacteraceae bacterium]|nr:hypothetical protein [Campylobacteraceae bacterium]
MEPTLETIEDFNGDASKSKKREVREAVMLCVGLGIALAIAASLFNTVPDYIGKSPIEKTNFNIPPIQ